MNFKHVLLTSIVCVLSFFSYSQTLTKNVVYLEVAGAGGFYSANIERTVAEKGEDLITARFGTALSKKGELYLIPGAAYLKTIGDNGDRFLEFGGGPVAFLGPTSRVYGFLNFGYRRQATDYNPLYWKANFTPLILNDPGNGTLFGYLVPWFGISAGYGF